MTRTRAEGVCVCVFSCPCPRRSPPLTAFINRLHCFSLAFSDMALSSRQVAVDRMHQRDATADGVGHFLILDTGHGKTVTSLVYAYRWLCKNGTFASKLSATTCCYFSHSSSSFQAVR